MEDSTITYEQPKRIWAAQPRRKHGWKTHWSVEPVENFNVTKSDSISPPAKFLGNGHEPWKLYIHIDEVNRMIAEAKSGSNNNPEHAAGRVDANL